MSAPPVRPNAASIGRCGRFSVHLVAGVPHMYEVPVGSACRAPGAEAQHLGPVEHLPPCYLELVHCRKAIAEARETIAARLALCGGGA